MSFLLVACGSSETDPASPTAATDVTAPTEETVEQVITESAEGSEVDADTEVDDDHEHGDDTHTHTDGVDLGLFYDGALAADATVVDCTLSDGTETMCYSITIAGTPANHDVGPFCPETTDTAAADAGIWFDGDDVYDVDGEFILGLADLYNDSNWKLYNDDGSVNITETAEEFDLAARPDVDPSLYNHCVAGQMEWLDNGEPVQTTVTIPIDPVPAESSSAGGNWSVTLNGVVIAASG